MLGPKMVEETPDDIKISLDQAELIVPKEDLQAPEPAPPVTRKIDPVEFFEFLGNFQKYPTNGLLLSEKAKKLGYSDELVKFFEAMPGVFNDESEIIPFAEDASKPPWGEVLGIDPLAGTFDSDELTLDDVKGHDT